MYIAIWWFPFRRVKCFPVVKNYWSLTEICSLLFNLLPLFSPPVTCYALSAMFLSVIKLHLRVEKKRGVSGCKWHIQFDNPFKRKFILLKVLTQFCVFLPENNISLQNKHNYFGYGIWFALGVFQVFSFLSEENTISPGELSKIDWINSKRNLLELLCLKSNEFWKFSDK